MFNMSASCEKYEYAMREKRKHERICLFNYNEQESFKGTYSFEISSNMTK